MPSLTYTRLINAVAPFIGREKATASVNRQLLRCGATPDSFTAAHLRQILDFLLGATRIHLAGKKPEQAALEASLRALR